MSWVLSFVIGILTILFVLYFVAGFGMAMEYITSKEAEKKNGVVNTVWLFFGTIVIALAIITIATHRIFYHKTDAKIEMTIAECKDVCSMPMPDAGTD